MTSTFFASKFHQKKCVQTTWIFRSSKLHQKKSVETTWIFRPSKLRQKKVHGNNVDFSISKITSKKYVEKTWKFVAIWSLAYRRNIDLELTLIRRGVPIGNALSKVLINLPQYLSK